MPEPTHPHEPARAVDAADTDAHGAAGPTSPRCAAPPRRWRERLATEEGASTAEYAIVVMASVALAAVLVMVAQSDAVKSAIENLMIDAFSY